ncbi:MAG: Ig-like domain-containing protein [Burkholderiales bacterium]
MNKNGHARTCAADPAHARGGRGASRRILAAAACAAAAFLSVPTAAVAGPFDTSCGGCHTAASGEPFAIRFNAANSSSVVWAASAANGMGFNSPTNVNAEIADLAALAPTPTDTATVNYTNWNAATTSVNYGSSRTVVVPNITLGGVLNVVSHSPAVTGVSFTGTTMTFNHPGGAGGNCSTRTVQAFGTGPSQGGVVPVTANRTITITVNAPAGPTANNDATTLNYSTAAQGIDLSSIGAITGTPAANGSFVSLGTLSPNVGTRVSTGPDTLTYASSATTYAPSLTLSYSVTGPCGTSSATRTLTINVNPPPAPVVTNRGSAGVPVVVPAGIPAMIDLTANISGVVASNPAGTYNLAASQPIAPGSGSTSVAGNVVTFTPGVGFTGPTTFTFTKDGPGGTSNTATVFLEVAAAPVVSPTSVTTAFNTAIPVNLAAFIASSQPVTSVTPSAPVNGTALATGPTTITFTPTPGFFGTGSFNYTATSAGGTSAVPATVTVTVNPPPPSVSPTAVTVPFNSGAPVVSTTIDLAALIGPPGATVLAVTPSGPVNGAVVATGPTTVSFTPTAGYVGPASFTYTATNAGGTSGSATVTVTVSAPPPPTAGPINVLVSSTATTPIDLSLAVSGVFSSVSVVSPPAAGSVSIAGFIATYTPSPGATGRYTFTYQATGLGGSSAPATVTLNYTDAPVANPLAVVVPYETTTPIDLARLISGFVTSFAISSPPTNGTLAVTPTSLSYTPRAGYFGPDSFQVTASGPGGTSVPGLVTITVNPPAPGAADLQVNVPFETATPITLPISGTFTQVTIVTLPANGLVSTPPPGSREVTYTPATGFSGADSFTFTATSAGGTSMTGTVNLTVASLKPSAAAATLTVALNTPATMDLRPFITGSGVTGVSIPKAPAHGTVSVNGTKVTYTPRRDFFGADSFTYNAFGNVGTSEPGLVTVNVVGRPDPAQDRNVVGLVDAQARTARRFSRAQIANFQRRLESLHAGPPAPTEPEAAGAPKAAAAPRAAPSTARERDAAADPFAFGNALAKSGFLPVSLTAGGAGPRPAAPAGFLQSILAGSLVSAATSNTIDLSAGTNGGGSGGLRPGTNVWLGGLAHFGKRGAGDEGADIRFSTDGLSLGADRRFSDRLVLGMGLGYGRDRTDIGSDGSRSKARGTFVAGYGSYQPTPSTFVDAVLGFGSLDLDSDRYVESLDEFATGTRKGRQVFGSVAAGYELRREGILISPYGRVDFSSDRLDASTESGAGLNALTFHEQTLRSTQAAAGLRVETRHETDYGWVAPRLRLEFRRELDGGRAANLSYADQAGGLVYSVTPAGSSRNSLLFGIGSDFLWRRGLRLGIDYQGERFSGPGTVQAVRFLLSQDLDGRLPAWPDAWSWKLLSEPVGVDIGYTFDDNVGRGRLAAEKLSDQVYSLGLNASRTFPLGEHSRAVATGFFSVDKFHDHTGLGRTSGGLQGELQYRASGDFDSVTYALFARAWIDGYESRLRSGSRYSFGANARRSLTDRIDVFGEVAANWRRAESAVFEGRDWAAKFNIDYSLGAAGTAYLAGEYRRGDTFSSGLGSLENLNSAEVLVRDDAFDRGEYFAYRAEARMLLGTLGYNRPLGPRDSIDFSVRRVQTTPLWRPENSGISSYIVNQYSILYLMRF